MPNISIIVPVYKVEKYLERCIESILAQTYKDFELILVNDGSPDSSGDICDNFKKVDERIRVIHKENGGLSSARNAGIDIACGKYIGFIDSDDWITEDMLEYLIGLINEYNGDIASVSYMFTNGETKITQPREIKVEAYERKEALRYYMKVGMSKRVSDYSVCTKLYKKGLFNEIKFPDGQLYEDGATNFELIQKASTYIKSNKICYFYYQQGASITRGGFKLKDMDLFIVGEQLLELARIEEDEGLLELAKMKKARSYFSLLAKIAVYGFDDDLENEEAIIMELTNGLRGSYHLLMKSPMPLNRKLMMSLLCVHINCLRVPVKAIRFLGV